MSNVLTAIGPHSVRDERARTADIATAMPLVAVCSLAASVQLRTAGITDDAAMVAIVALAGVALIALRNAPQPDAPAWRPLTTVWSLALAVVAAILVAATLVPGLSNADLVGPATTAAILAAYLVSWGFRSQPVLRTMAILSLFSWPVVASTAHDIVSASLTEPSELVYRRLAELRVFGVTDEPWRLFTAELHRGALVVIATVVFCLITQRRRVSFATVVEVSAAVAVAVVVHHAAVLAAPIDRFTAGATPPVVTHPVFEVGVGVAAVIGLAAARQLTGRPRTRPEPRPVDDDIVDRDPVIFAVDAAHHRTASLLTLTGLAPIIAISLIG